MRIDKSAFIVIFLLGLSSLFVSIGRGNTANLSTGSFSCDMGNKGAYTVPSVHRCDLLRKDFKVTEI